MEPPSGSVRAEAGGQAPQRKQELTREQAERFSRFWQCYPRKVAKGEARKAWRQIDPDDELTERICSALDLARQTEQWRREGGRFIPHPATWLRREGWEDQLEPEVECLGTGESERVSATITNLQELFGGPHG